MVKSDNMNEEETRKKIDMIRFHLHNTASDILFVGRYSDHVYQAKFERYANEIDKIIRNLIKDEYN